MSPEVTDFVRDNLTFYNLFSKSDAPNCRQIMNTSLLCKRLLRTLKRLSKLLDLKSPTTPDSHMPAKTNFDILLECITLAVTAIK